MTVQLSVKEAVLTVAIALQYFAFTFAAIDSDGAPSFFPQFLATLAAFVPPPSVICASVWLGSELRPTLLRAVTNGFVLNVLLFAVTVVIISGDLIASIASVLISGIFGFFASIIIAAEVLLGVIVHACANAVRKMIARP